MSKFAYKTTLRRLKSNNGVIGDLPRIHNLENGTYSYGYAEFNQDATSPFVRTKVHKLRVDGGATITDGDLIEDRLDGSRYLVMNVKPVYGGGANGRVCYYDGVLYYCNSTATINRFTEGTKNAFGIDTDPAPITVANNVPVMVNPMNMDSFEQQDIILQKSKIKVAVQSKYGVKEHDRIITDLGDVYSVTSVDKSSLTGVWTLFVEADIR